MSSHSGEYFPGFFPATPTFYRTHPHHITIMFGKASLSTVTTHYIIVTIISIITIIIIMTIIIITTITIISIITIIIFPNFFPS